MIAETIEWYTVCAWQWHCSSFSGAAPLSKDRFLRQQVSRKSLSLSLWSVGHICAHLNLKRARTETGGTQWHCFNTRATRGGCNCTVVVYVRYSIYMRGACQRGLIVKVYRLPRLPAGYPWRQHPVVLSLTSITPRRPNIRLSFPPYTYKLLSLF